MTEESPKPRVVGVGNMKAREWVFIALVMVVVGAGFELAYGAIAFVSTTVLVLAYGFGLWAFRNLRLKKRAIDVLEKIDD